LQYQCNYHHGVLGVYFHKIQLPEIVYKVNLLPNHLITCTAYIRCPFYYSLPIHNDMTPTAQSHLSIFPSFIIQVIYYLSVITEQLIQLYQLSFPSFRFLPNQKRTWLVSSPNHFQWLVNRKRGAEYLVTSAGSWLLSSVLNYNSLCEGTYVLRYSWYQNQNISATWHLRFYFNIKWNQDIKVTLAKQFRLKQY